MLSSLSVNNLALVRDLELDFSPGFISISGETGAGKSLMIAALGLVLGDKPRRLDEENCRISAEFILAADSPAACWLAERGMHQEDGGQITALVRRTITARRSKAFINGAQVGVGELGQLGDLLLNLHSQHQHHALLQRAYQREMFDAFAGARTIAGEVSHLYALVTRLRKALNESANRQQLAQRELELARHNLKELDALAPREGEYAELDQQHRLAGKSRRLQELLAQLLACLEGDGEANGMHSRLRKTSLELVQLDISTLNELTETIANADALLEEVVVVARRLADGDLDQAAYAELEERIAGYHQLARKHQRRAQELPALQRQLREQLEQLASQAAGPKAIGRQLAESEAKLADKARQLSTRRLEAAPILEERVNGLLPDLAMTDACFSLQLEQRETPSGEGYEKPGFLMRTNQGGKLLPLKDIASGGELSRASLALYLACSAGASPATMVFDEVDTGLSGKVAAKVGRILKQLARRHQVLCITHHPQIVAQADQHLFVSKESDATGGSVMVQRLDSEGAVAEIARMLGGGGKAGVQLARDMYLKGREAEPVKTEQGCGRA